MDPDAVLAFCVVLAVMVLPVRFWVLHRMYRHHRSGDLDPERFGYCAANAPHH